MNNQKIDWIFEATRCLLENNPTTNDEERRKALLDEAERIQVDEEAGEENE